MRHHLFSTTAHPAAILIRLAVGFVFLVAGTRKLTDIEGGIGFFGNIGIPMPEVMFPFVAVMEVLCGSLVLIGLVTRLAAIPLAIIMVVALITTKLPQLPDGVSDFLNASRLDFTMLLCAIYLIWVGAGRWSVDARVGGAELWDRQLEEDVATGRLDDLTDEALAEDRAGRTRPL